MNEGAKQVLIVEDEPLVAAAIRDALLKRGRCAAIVAKAREALQWDPPSVLIVDALLEGMDGLDLAERLLARSPQSRLILISSAPTFSACRRALHLGAVDFLQKPFRLDDLAESVEACLRPEQEPGPTVRRPPLGELAFARSYSVHPRTPETAVRDLLGYCLRCNIGPATRARIGTALAEAVTNACKHAYGEQAGEVDVTARIEESSLLLVVRDYGCGFDPAVTCAQACAQGSATGLQRARALTEDMTIDSRLGQGTSIGLRFSCSRVDFEEGRKIDLSDLDYLPPLLAKGVVARLNESQGDQVFHLSPATAVTIGRLLAGPEVRPFRSGEALR